MFIAFLIVWGIIGGLSAASAIRHLDAYKATKKQWAFILFLLGPGVWAVSLVVGIIYAFVWTYEALGNNKKK